jgi:hypothetical protein
MLRSDSSSSYSDHHVSGSAAGDASDSQCCQQEGETANQSALDFLHQAPPFNLAELDDNLLAPTLAAQDSKHRDTAFLYQASPYDLSELDDDLLSTSDSMADKDAWLYQAPPFDLDQMDRCLYRLVC